jgi:hypothetical protein
MRTKKEKKEENLKRKIKKMEGHYGFPSTSHRQAVLPNVFLKQIQLTYRICSTGTATAGAATV